MQKLCCNHGHSLSLIHKPAFVFWFVLTFFGLGFMLIAPFSINAQDDSEIEQSLGYQPGFDPDSQVFTAAAKAVYWEKMAKTALSNGDQETANDNYNESLEFINEAIVLDSRSAFLYTRLAELSMTLESYSKAKTAVEIALDLNPSSADAHFLLGRMKYLREQDRKGALEEFRKAAESDPEHLKAQLYLASLAYDAGENALAADAYSHLVRLTPYNPELRYKLGISYSKMGEINKAIDELKSATMLDENHLDAHLQLAYLYTHQSRNDEAIEECLIVMKRIPQYPDTFILLSQLYTAKGDYDKAISIAQELLKRGNSLKPPTVAETYYRLGMAYKEKGDMELAHKNLENSIDLYTELLKANARDGDANYKIALVYDAKGDFKMAKNYLGRYIALEPNDANAYNYLGYLLVERGEELSLAIDYIQKALSLEPNNGAFRDSLGWAYFKAGKLDEAIAELEKAAELAPDDSEVREHLGEAYLKMGGDFTQKAIQEWEKALELKPSKAELRQRLSSLYAQMNSKADN